MKTNIKVYRDETKNYSPNFSGILFNIANPRSKKRNPYKLMLYMFLTGLAGVLVSVMTTNNPISYANNEDYAQSLQRKYEVAELYKRCLKNQIKRITNNEKVSDDYCTNYNNLIQFSEKNTVSSVRHKDWALDDERQDWINYAYKIGGKDFLLTILAENGTMGIDRKSNIVGANGYSDYGLCQINVGYHPEILSDGTNGKRFVDWFYDPYKQLDYCNEKFQGGTRFYGYDVRHTVENKLKFDL